MRRNSLCFLLLLQFLIQVPALAEPLSVTLEVEKTTVYVSGKVPVIMTLHGIADHIEELRVDTGNTTDFIIKTPDLTENNAIANNMGMIIRPPTWQFLVYPQKSGPLSIGPFSVSFTISQSLSTDARKVQLQTNALSLDVKTPPGAPDGAFVLVTPEMTVSTSYTPDISELKVGDAIQRIITIKAVNVPDVLIPAVTTDKLPGVHIYPADPLLTETPSPTDAIVITASRVQKDTFVAVSDGEIRIPTQKLFWYDGKKLHCITIAPKTIKIKAAVIPKEEEKGKTLQYLAAIVVLLSALVLLSIFVWKQYLKTRLAIRKEQHGNSEQGRFEQLQAVVGTGDPLSVYQAFYFWADSAIHHREPMDFKRIIVKFPDAEEPLAMLNNALQGEAELDPYIFMSGIKRLREAVLKTGGNHPCNLINSMNPV